ncbi:MAG: phosphatidate cytidylyltransferase [Deltaproteobacteria bacterium]|nr:phosphatidate cytidylyltransferase [Deltaproteobacteria bacterium]MBW2662391.1 phosphatidate cytidylyltransferase [Deltaproteobacteria bacterium]
MHLKRWITAIAALPFLFWVIFKGGPLLFAALIIIVSILSLREYFRITLNNSVKTEDSNRLHLKVFAFIVGPVIILAAFNNVFDIIIALIILNLIVSSLYLLRKFRSDPLALEAIAKQVMGIIYIPLFLSCLVLIRNSFDGIKWVFFLLLLVFACDTGAYYIGTYMGRRKLCPSISPGKTIEGSIGGFTASLGAGLIFKNFFLPQMPLGSIILFCLSIAAAGQVGDLFESALKRSANVKDSGTILPGHGGILDRIDALLFAAPVAYFLKEYMF